MSKGSMFNVYFLLFVSGAILAIVLIYAMIFGGLGVAKSLLYYDARTIVEMLASETSAVASHQGDFNRAMIYRGSLPSGVCDFKVEDNKISMKIPEQLVSPLGVRYAEVKVKTTEAQMEIPVPKYIEIKPFTATCEKGVSRTIIIQKQGNLIWFNTA